MTIKRKKYSTRVKLVCAHCYKQLLDDAFVIEEEKKKKETPKVQDALRLIFYYKKQFVALISNKEPIFNQAMCISLARKHITNLGYDRVKTLMDAYLKSDDKFYQDNAYSLSLFLSDNVINKFNIFVQ